MHSIGRRADHAAWGYPEREVVPASLFRISSAVGGVVLARVSGRLGRAVRAGLRFSGHAGRTALAPLAPAGGGSRLARQRGGGGAQAGAARTRRAAGPYAHDLDIRSADSPQRPAQPGQAGRGRRCRIIRRMVRLRPGQRGSGRQIDDRMGLDANRARNAPPHFQRASRCCRHRAKAPARPHSTAPPPACWPQCPSTPKPSRMT